MWYLAGLTIASQTPSPSGDYFCEECNVLFESDSAQGAYEKAIAWAAANSDEQSSLLGIRYLTTVGESIGEGVDICGRVFTEANVWERQPEFSPPTETLGAFFSEQTMDTPIDKAIGAQPAKQLQEHLGILPPDADSLDSQ